VSSIHVLYCCTSIANDCLKFVLVFRCLVTGCSPGSSSFSLVTGESQCSATY
jgi:hypothetical protein